MSITKRVWVEQNPAYESVRRKYQEELHEYLREFTERLPLRKYCQIEGKRKIDVTWRLAVQNAIKETNVESMTINEGAFFKSKSDLCAVKAIAIKTHPDLFAKYGLKAPRRCPTCNSILRSRLAKRGRNSGRHFLGCAGYPECHYTEDCTDAQDEFLWKLRGR